MKRRCKPCKEWEEHFYWNHFKPKGMCFFKVMDSGFSQGLLIPEKFVKNFKGKLPPTLNLRSPSRNLWSVRLLNVPGALVMKDGWKVFVDAHHVVEDDVLVFKYDGNSCFDVLMFNQSGCENEASYFVRSSNNNLEEYQVKEEDNEDSSDALINGSRRVFERCCSEEHRNDKRTSPGVQKKRTNYRRRNTKPGSSKNTNSATQSVLKRRQITATEEKKALQAAEAFETVNHSFIVVMRRSHVFKRFFMTIPSSFASLHFDSKKQSVILHVPGEIKEWHVRYASVGCSWGFEGKEWQLFVIDNNLYEGDACVFELITSKGELEINVHIFRAGQK